MMDNFTEERTMKNLKLVLTNAEMHELLDASANIAKSTGAVVKSGAPGLEVDRHMAFALLLEAALLPPALLAKARVFAKDGALEIRVDAPLPGEADALLVGGWGAFRERVAKGQKLDDLVSGEALRKHQWPDIAMLAREMAKGSSGFVVPPVAPRPAAAPSEAQELTMAALKGMRARLNVMSGEAAARGDHGLAMATGAMATVIADELEARK